MREAQELALPSRRSTKRKQTRYIATSATYAGPVGQIWFDVGISRTQKSYASKFWEMENILWAVGVRSQASLFGRGTSGVPLVWSEALPYLSVGSWFGGEYMALPCRLADRARGGSHTDRV